MKEITQDRTDIQIFENKIKNCTPDQLRDLAKQEVENISKKIDSMAQKIVESKKLVSDAENVDNSFLETINIFGKSEEEKKIEILTKIAQITNNINEEQNELIKETIKLICCDMAFANLMIDEMASTMMSQDKDLTNSISDLSDDALEIASEIKKEILYHARQRIKDLQETKQKIEDLEKDIIEIEDIIQKNIEYKKHYDQIIKEQTLKINELQTNLNKKNIFANTVSSIALILCIITMILNFWLIYL
ncbi:hypothetical protein [Campylobacter taeniopygiae]|uniref:hypothetical protein n=1 Tax=Campylobacter taeniopygiae TaxID=2510188 RepID=UPI003D6C16EF